jgi:outer membrane lipoprotein-sorting protein
MRSRSTILLALVVLTAAVLVTGVAVAGAESTPTLPDITASDLLAGLAGDQDKPAAVSGDVSWINSLLGDLPQPAGGHGGARLPLAADGSGRLWLSDDGARVESQGENGDITMVAPAGGREAWMYEFRTDTATHLIVEGGDPEAEAPHAASSPVSPDAMTALITRLAPTATVEVAGQVMVAGRESYLLRLTPTATDTALAKVEAAIDGERFVPLRLQVFARDVTDPVVSMGFDRISYQPIDPATFAFTPPPGATVVTRTIDADGHGVKPDGAGDQPDEATRDRLRAALRGALLPFDRAQELAGFDLVRASDQARPFRWAYVIDGGMPLTLDGSPLFGGMGPAGDLLAPGGVAARDANKPPQLSGPLAVQLYGDGLGVIVLAQTKTTPDIERRLRALPEVIGTVEAGDGTGRVLTTALGGAVVWTEGDTTVVAAGMVPPDDLLRFARSVR